MTSSSAALLRRLTADFSSSRFLASNHAVTSFSTGSLVGQPHHALSPLARMPLSSGVDAVRAGVPRVKHLPATLARRGLLSAAGTNRAPIGRDEVDIHAHLL